MSDKPKTKQKITPERRAQLLEQLARGRETSRMKRLSLIEEKTKPKVKKVKKVKKLIDHEEKVINITVDNLQPNNRTTKQTKPPINSTSDTDLVIEPVMEPVMKQHEDLTTKNILINNPEELQTNLKEDIIERPKKLRMSGIQFNPWMKPN